MTNVVTLEGVEIVTPEAEPGIVQLLEDLLERARAGEIVAGIVIVTNDDGTIGRYNTDHQPERNRVLGALYRQADEMMADWREGR
jgi:hypothetical protein